MSRFRFAAIALSVAVLGSSLGAQRMNEAVPTESQLLGPGHSHSEKHKLGRKQIGGYTVSVIIIGEVEAGKHVDFDIKLIEATSDPKALRVWIGKQDASGSKKAEGKKGATTYAGEVDVPTELPEGWQVWVEIETANGVESAGYTLEPHKH